MSQQNITQRSFGPARKVAQSAQLSVGLLHAWLGEYSPLIGFLIGAGSYLLADWILSTKSDREARRQEVIALFRERWVTVMKWGTPILMCAYFLISSSEPSDPAVNQVFSLVQMFGLLAVVFVPFITSAISMATWSARPSVAAGLCYHILAGFAFYSMALWMIGHSGDDLYGWVIENPHDAAMGAVALAIVWMIVHCSGRTSFRSESIARSSGAAAMAVGAIGKPTTRGETAMLKGVDRSSRN